MEVRSDYSNGWHIIGIEGKFVIKHLMVLRKVLDDIHSQVNCGDIVFDLSDTEYIDSSALTLMLNVFKRQTEKGKKTAICSPCDQISDVFSIVGFDKIIEIYPSLNSLLNS